jgi:hypothetical protein
MMRTPAAGVLMRKLSDANAPSDFVERLGQLADERREKSTEEPSK